MSTNKPHLVILGGAGLGGHRAAYKLRDDFELTLIDPKSFMEVPMAMPRQLVSPDELNSIVPLSEFLPQARCIPDKVAEVQQSEVVLQSGETVSFDYLLIANGSNYGGDLAKPVAGDREGRLAFYKQMNAKIKASKNILIIGGGPIGVEISGELANDFPGKKVTLIEREGRLLPNAAEKLGNWAADQLRDRNVEVICGDTVETPAVPASEYLLESGTASTANGKTIDYDLIFWCLGTRADASFMGAHFSETINERQEIDVDDCFRVGGHQNIFAVGDGTSIPHKGGISLHNQLGTLVPNLKQIAKYGASAELKPFGGVRGADMAVVSLGRRAGVMKLPFGMFKAKWLAKKIKSQHMLVNHLRKDIGLSPQ